MTLTNRIRVAIQKNGRLKYPSMDFISSLGLVYERDETNRQMTVVCKNANVELLFVRNSDIPEYVKSGVADYGIVGENVLHERGDVLQPIKKLGFGKCRLAVAVPLGSNIKAVADLQDERIATSYPNSLKNHLASNDVRASVVVINGSVEITPSLNLADAICDITQTGDTLRCHDLRPIETILESEAVLIESPFVGYKRHQFLNLLK